MINWRPPLLLASIILSGASVYIAFANYYGQESPSIILLNNDFRYWTREPQGGLKPYMWTTDYFLGGNDSISLIPTRISGRECMKISVYQDGLNDSYTWASVHIRQDIRGQALREFLKSKIGIWLYVNFSYKYAGEMRQPLNVFGVEINDGSNLLWFVFSDSKSEAYSLPSHRIVIVETPLHQWSYREIDVGAEYAKLTRKQPDSLSFSLVMGSTRNLPGTFQGYFSKVLVD